MEPLYERVGLLPTAAALSQSIDKARRQVEWCQVALGETHPGTAQAQTHLGELLFLRSAQDDGDPGAAGPGSPEINEEAAAEEVLRRAHGLLASGGPILSIEVAAALRLLRAGPAGVERADALLRHRCEGASFGLAAGPGLRQAAALHELRAALLFATGRPAEAEALARRVVQALEQGAQPGPAVSPSEREQDDLSAALGNLAILLHRSGRDSEAEALLSRALQIRLRLFGERDPRTSRSARNLAALLWRTGQLSRAEAPLLLSQRAWPLQTSAQPSAQPNAREAVKGLLWLGAFYHEQAQAQRPVAPRAEAILRAALRIGQQADPESALLAQGLLAELLLAQGRLREAGPLVDSLLEARRRPGADPEALLQAVALRAAIEEQRGDPAAAAALLRRALDSAAGKTAGPLAVLLRGQLGRALLSRGQEQLLASRVAVAGPIQAQAQAQTDDPGPGQDGPSEESLGQALDALAAHALSVLPAAPSPALDSGVRATTAALVGTLLAAAERPIPVSRQTASALLRALDAPLLSGALAEALGGAQAPGERGRLWRLMRQRADLLLDPTPRRPWAERQARLWQLAEAIRAAEGAAGPGHAPLEALLRRREWDAVRIEQALSQRGQGEGTLVVLLRGAVPPAPAAKATSGPTNGPAAAVILHRDGLPLPPLRGPHDGPGPASASGPAVVQARQARQARDHYGALLLRPGREARLFDLGEAAPVDEAADRLLRLAEAQRDLVPVLRQLGQRLITPIEQELGRGERISVLLPPPLSALPLSALPLSDGRPLCARGPVRALDDLDALFLSMPTSMPAEAGAGAGTTRRGADADRRLRHMLLLGAPTLRDDVLAGLLSGQRAGLPAHDTQTLALAPAEMNEVGALLRAHRYDPRGGPVLGLAATRTRLQAWLPSRVVHLLAPILLGGGGDAAPAPMQQRVALPFLALVSPSPPDAARRAPEPGRQGLALASFYSQEPGLRLDLDQGLVGPEDLARLDLRDTALLVLSGPLVASSARGAGAGLAALRRAARRAGAREVLATLWRPQEAQARDLMLRFYAAWLRSGDAADAVRQVQVEAHRRGEPPLLWAGLSAGR